MTTAQVEYWYERIVEEEPLLADVDGVQDYEYRLGTEVGEDHAKVSLVPLSLSLSLCPPSLSLLAPPLLGYLPVSSSRQAPRQGSASPPCCLPIRGSHGL
jgi:hypothetical protein